MNSTISSTKTRISKKSMTALPAAVAEAVRDIQDGHPNIKSFTFHAVTPSHEFRPWENETWTVVMADDQRSIETAAEHRMGASGQYDFGGAFKAPVGAFVLRISYYTRYFLDIYNVQPAPLEAPEPVITVTKEPQMVIAASVKNDEECALEDNLLWQAYSHSVDCDHCRRMYMVAQRDAELPEYISVKSFRELHEALIHMEKVNGFAVYKDGVQVYVRQQFGSRAMRREYCATRA